MRADPRPVPSFLTEMARWSRERSRLARRRVSLDDLRARAARSPSARVPRLLEPGFDLLAEVKPASPSRGRLAALPPRAHRALGERIAAYARAGAAAISVLSEPRRFGGSLGHVRRAARLSPVPVLRKDFLVDAYQVWEARAAGADGVLLIARLVTEDVLAEQLAAAREAGLFVLLEAFDRADLARIAACLDGARAPGVLVGVNARDLATLEVRPGRLLELASLLPPGVPAVAESGIESPADAAACARAGYRAALVGTALMRAPDPAALARRLLAAAREALA